MNLQQRLHQLEQTQPMQDAREPLLIEFISNDPDEPSELAGILYRYNGQPEQRLNSQELKDLEL